MEILENPRTYADALSIETRFPKLAALRKFPPIVTFYRVTIPLKSFNPTKDDDSYIRDLVEIIALTNPSHSVSFTATETVAAHARLRFEGVETEPIKLMFTPPPDDDIDGDDYPHPHSKDFDDGEFESPGN